MKVLKFGGTSVRDAERIGRVADLVAAEVEGSGQPCAVVVSAMGGVTDDLHAAASSAAGELRSAERLIAEVEHRHQEVLERLARPEDRAELSVRQGAGFVELRETLRGISLIEECSARTLDKVLSWGELLCAPLVAAAIRARGFAASDCDTRRLIRTDAAFGRARVDDDTTFSAVRECFAHPDEVLVLTGFIASSPEGHTTTLGRGGSDYTAALVAAALGAEEIQIWTDVDGVMSADPRLVPLAFSLSILSYEELLELSHFGAKVIYPPTVLPARRAGIPLLIKNTLDPSFEGTRVVESHPSDSRHPVTGIASVDQVTLIRLEGDGMLGVPGITGRVFAALARAEVNVILISQGSSEHSICFAVAPEQTATASKALAGEFRLERQVGLIRDPVVEEDQSVIAVVGEGMRDRPGIAGRLFRELGAHRISVRAIAQGSSELNISFVLRRGDVRRAVRVVHDAFFAAQEDRLEVFVAGPGRVGSALLRQVASVRAEGRLPFALHLAAVLSSRHLWLDAEGLDPAAADDPSAWRRLLAERGVGLDLERLLRFVDSRSGPRVFVDCSASEELAPLYLELLRRGCSVVAANKLPLSASLASYRDLLAARRPFARGLYYETTVGAALPVLRTLRSLIETGDRLLRFEGTLSGTLGFLCSALRSKRPFGEALRDAHRRGLTEPDPRDDLSGQDVARKLLILGREAGFELESEDVAVRPLLEPSELMELGCDDFLQRVSELDAPLAERAREAAERGQTLVYLARLDERGAEVGLEAVALDHPCASGGPTDNVLALHTARYCESPLVLQGPGAGTEVTAAGVLADLVQAHAESAPEPSPIPMGRAIGEDPG